MADEHFKGPKSKHILTGPFKSSDCVAASLLTFYHPPQLWSVLQTVVGLQKCVESIIFMTCILFENYHSDRKDASPKFNLSTHTLHHHIHVSFYSTSSLVWQAGQWELKS